MIESKNYLTIPQAAKICSVDRSTMHRWVVLGKIAAYSTPGGHKRIQTKHLELFFKNNNMPITIDGYKNENIRILIVDDDPAVQDLLTEILLRDSIRVETANDGFEAGVKLISFKPHLIILDLYMPNMDGFEVCRRIKEDPDLNKIKILVMTGHGTKENKNSILSLGADAFLAKPSSKKNIISCVEKLLEKQ